MRLSPASSALAAVIAASSLLAVPAATAQQAGSTARPADQPPIAQAWIDIATFASPGMPGGMAGMMMGGGGNSPLGAMLGGGKAQGNQFGLTQASGAGRYVDVTLRTRQNPNLAEAVQGVPAASQLAPTLQLNVLPQAKPVPETDVESVEPPAETPKGKIKLYWGCGTTVRPGQPKVLDFATANLSQLGEIFKGRRATQRGAHAAPGRPVWPNPQDPRPVPAAASLAGEHTFTGQGVPENFKFTLPAAQDLMPAIALQQSQADGVTQLSWQPLPTARAYFIAAMGGKGDDSGAAEMTLWTSSELPDSGMGLIDYQTNKSVDQWLKEKVLLPPSTTRCDVPKGIFGEGEQAGAMLRMIAYGTELNLAHPPRPADPKVAWKPDWGVKVRVKSVAMSMLGMPSMEGMDGAALEDGTPGTDAAGTPASEEQPKKKKKFSMKDALDAVKDAVPVP